MNNNFHNDVCFSNPLSQDQNTLVNSKVAESQIQQKGWPDRAEQSEISTNCNHRTYGMMGGLMREIMAGTVPSELWTWGLVRKRKRINGMVCYHPSYD